MRQVFIARHGNTFDKGDVVTRVGGRTDLPLSNSGQEQAQALAAHFAQQGVAFTRAYCSPLQRTRQTALAVLDAQGGEIELSALPFLTEVDYGPDENRPEEDVVARIGAAALKAWEEEAIPPQGWLIDPPAVVARWQEFFSKVAKGPEDQCILLVTSNGIARFALQALSHVPKDVNIKLKTCAYGLVEITDAEKIELQCWNQRA
ncbi:histidine phosphatase family protein [Polycladidibacter stylochi]|uniref:histidine phosphatase family protein n=1 Tax=Polycladidibacter stylochi TaxID=1807766 RepID=UPI000833A2DC|nr:histidine phosphatase family protein [Pseudovibrio stylochi]